MRKILPLASLLIFVFLVLFIVASPRPTELPIEFVSELETEEKEKFTACLLRADGNLVLLEIEKKNHENIYLYALKIYDHYRNSLPPKYQTPLKGNFEVKKLEKKGRELQIELEFLYLEENFKTFLTALMWTYQNLGIDSVVIKSRREEFRLEKNETVNLRVENPYASESQIVYFHEGEEILPVTYLHSEDRTSFLIKKILAHSPGAGYSYEDHDGFLFLEIQDPRHEITPALIESLAYNLKELGLHEEIVIIKNGILVYNN